MLTTQPADAPSRTRLDETLDAPGMPALLGIITALVIWWSWHAWSPLPVVQDEMAYLLQAQIFARGKWALPSPPLPVFWEQPHVLVDPVLASKYFPGHSLLLAIGALLGWPALVPLLLQGVTGALVFALARRVAGGAVALLAWVIWTTSPMVLYFGGAYYSEATTAACWLGGWYGLLRWREQGTLRWLLLATACAGWMMLTRPLTAAAYIVPCAVLVVREVIRTRRWRHLAAATAIAAVLACILPLWSAQTTGDWRSTPHALYSRQYMPYDHPGFGLDTTRATRAMPIEIEHLNTVYASYHVHHDGASIPLTLLKRTQFLLRSVFASTNGVLAVFVLLGLLTLDAVTGFATLGAIVLVVAYLAYATPAQWSLYYYEIAPMLAYLAAAGVALALSCVLAWARAAALADVPWRRAWRLPRLHVALTGMAALLLVPGAFAFQRMQRAHDDQRLPQDAFLHLVAQIPSARALLFVRHAPRHDPNVTYVRNVPDLASARVWIVYDRGAAENARLLALASGRVAYLFDESAGVMWRYAPPATR